MNGTQPNFTATITGKGIAYQLGMEFVSGTVQHAFAAANERAAIEEVRRYCTAKEHPATETFMLVDTDPYIHLKGTTADGKRINKEICLH